MNLSTSKLQLPDFETLLRVLTLQDYNTRVVVIGTTLLGIAAGLVGSFLLLRKRALLSDAVSHATLPGIVLAFIVMASAGGTGKSLPGLLLGAAITGTLGMLGVIGISRFTRLKDDVALGIVLSVFFGIGVALMRIATRMETGTSAGLSAFIYGKTASMLLSDALLIGSVAALAAATCGLLFKEFSLVCFDSDFAATQGWPVMALDLLIMSLVVIVTIIGLQAVGLILVVALLITPPAAARFWTDDLRRMLLLSALIGGLAGLIGSAVSALMENLPAGAVIVLVAAALFLISLLFGSARGFVPRLVRHSLLSRRIARQHLLRALYELSEADGETRFPERLAHPFAELLTRRSWTTRQLRRVIRQSQRLEHVRRVSRDQVALTTKGAVQARKLIRNHRLWEMYLITHADIAPNHVDRDADMVEHILDEEMIARLERLILADRDRRGLPPSPHHLAGAELRP